MAISRSNCQPPTIVGRFSIYQLIKQSINQSINQPSNQAINQYVFRLILGPKQKQYQLTQFDNWTQFGDFRTWSVAYLTSSAWYGDVVEPVLADEVSSELTCILVGTAEGQTVDADLVTPTAFNGWH